MFQIEPYLLMLMASIIMSIVVYFVTPKSERISLLKWGIFCLILFIGTILSSLISQLAYRIFFLILVLVLLVKGMYRLPFSKSILTAVTAYFLYIFGDIAVGLVMINGLGYQYEDVTGKFNLSLMAHLIILLANLLFILILVLIRNLLQKDKIRNFFQFPMIRVKFRIVFITYLLITIFLIGIFGELHTNMRVYGENDMTILIAGAIIVYFLISLMVIYLYRVALQKQFQFDEKEKDYNQLVLYTEVVEGLIKDVRIHKHNYANTLASIKGFLDAEDYSSLKKYFYEEILTDEVMKGKDAFSALQKITNPGIKGLLATKMNYALLHQIQFDVEILEEINLNLYRITTIDICKILGIFLDNATEAAKESERKNVSLLISKNKNEISIVITNTFKEPPKINKIFEYGYSTKGERRGIGLNTVKNLLDTKYHNMLLNTIIEEDTFIVELIINEP